MPRNTSTPPPTTAAIWSDRVGLNTMNTPIATIAAPRSARPAGLGPGHQTSEAMPRGLEVLRIECGGRGSHRQPEQREQQRPYEQVADECVEEPRDRVAHLLVGDLVLALHAGERAGAQDQQGDRDQRADRANRNA